MTLPDLLLIGGPTAAGKSSLAMMYAQKHNGVVINTDSMQIYKGLEILTAQPPRQDLTAAPHALYGFVDADCSFSVAEWLRYATQTIQETSAQGKLPVLVGGTGLYFHALTNGLANIPDVPLAVRDALTQFYEEKGENAFRETLRQVDPSSDQRIKPNDRQRLVRALAVVQATGKPLSYWHEKAHEESPFRLKTIRRMAVLPERNALYKKCDKRFEQMMDKGAVDEVKALLKRGLSFDLPAMKSLGVREIADYLAGNTSLETAVQQAQQSTRNYAKRQVTWFKNQWKDAPNTEIYETLSSAPLIL